MNEEESGESQAFHDGLEWWWMCNEGIFIYVEAGHILSLWLESSSDLFHEQAKKGVR